MNVFFLQGKTRAWQTVYYFEIINALNRGGLLYPRERVKNMVLFS